MYGSNFGSCTWKKKSMFISFQYMNVWLCIIYGPFFYFVCLFYLLGLSFEVLSPKTFCPRSSLITKLDQCQVAATYLSLPFGRSGEWTNNRQLGGCISYAGKVYFNSALQVGDINTVNIGYRAICVKGEDIEHIICTYNDRNYNYHLILWLCA